jgi:hypothetical protein
MARPVKNTVDYFPHDSNHKTTIYILEEKYGNDGYAFWFKLLELLASTEGHFYDCRKPGKWEFLQAKTHFSEDKCLEILNLLVELEAIDKDLWGEKVIWSDNFISRIADVYKNRRVEIPSRPNFYKEKPDDVEVSTDENPQSKVKESKVNNNSIVEESSEEDSQPPKKSKWEREKEKQKPIDIELSKLLMSLIVERLPDYRELEKQEKCEYVKWGQSIRLMREQDKRDPIEIREIIEWCQEDNFWKDVVLSTANLKEKYDQMKLQKNKKTQSKYPQRYIAGRQ